MENNIFENAYFGEIFVTKDGTKHSFCSFTKSGFDTCARLYREGWGIVIFYLDGQLHSGGEFGNGIDFTIVGRLYEPVDEEKLDRMAKQYTGYSGFWPEYDLNGNDKDALREAYKAGCYKMLELMGGNKK